jgi:PAS domain S-box-containing protein
MVQESTYDKLIKKIETLEEKEQLYRQLFNTAMVGIYRTRLADGKFLAANKTLANMMGYRSVDTFISEFVTSKHYVDPNRRQELMAQLEQHNQVDGFETEMVRVDGSTIQIALSATAYPEKGYSEGVIIDITDRKRAESALRNSERRYRTISEITSDYAYAFRVEPDGKLVNEWTTGALQRVTGYSRNEFIALGGWDFLIHPDDVAITQNQLKVLLSNRKQVVEYRIVTKEDQVRWMRDDARPVWSNSEARVIRIEGAVRDITDSKQAQEALKSAHIRFLTVLESIDATIYVADMETHEILFMNKHMIDSFGRDMTGEICWQVFRCESEACPHCTNERLVDKYGKPTGVYVWQGENPVTGKWYSNYDRAIEWTDGRLVRIQIATDITELKRMEEELRQAHKMEAIGTLAGGIAHNFNNLLMGILGRASLMSVDLDPSHPFGEHINAIHEYTRSAVNLTKQLLGFVRGGKYEVKPMDLNELVLESTDMFGRTRKEIRIHTKTGKQKIVVEADRSQIEQVLLNLYVNAWQAMPDGGELYLATSIVRLDEQACKAYQLTAGQYARISVTDTGTGMNEETRQRIFDPFFSTKDKGKGTGLGLASAYGIIKNHGGIIIANSKLDYGTTFNIYLPASEIEMVKQAPIQEEITGGSESILLIDDEKMIRDVSKAMLEKLGYTVTVAGSGMEAIEIIEKSGSSFDLIILDMIMPGMDGGVTFDKIREVQPAIPIILSSGYTIDGQAAEIMDRGCNGFIQKPFTMSNLSQKIMQTLDKTQA